MTEDLAQALHDCRNEAFQERLKVAVLTRHLKDAMTVLQPIADKWLYPDDIGEGFDKDEINDDESEEVFIKRGSIRAARNVLKAARESIDRFANAAAAAAAARK